MLLIFALYILKILLYFLLIFVTYYIGEKCYGTKNKYPIIIIFLLCILFGTYSLICGQVPYASDRLNFAFRFQSDYYLEYVRNESYGLYIIERILHTFTYEPKFLFFSVSFLYMFVSLIAYKKNDYMKPKSLLFLLITTYPIYGFYMLKQALAMSFISLGFAYLYKNKIKSYVFFAIAIMFHEAALLLIPMIVILKLLNKYKTFKNIIYISIIIFSLFFVQFNSNIISIVIKIIPQLQGQLNQYLNSIDGSIVSGDNLMTIFKGIPFYVTFIVGYYNRKKINQEKYHDFMFIVFTVAISIFLSKYMYWMFRFGLLLYLPASIFTFDVYKSIKYSKNKILYLILTYGIMLILTIRIWFQYYFLYGGL